MATERDAWKHASEQLPLVNARQREILDLIERGHTNQEIADHFEMTLAGAKWHVSDLLSKLGLSTREEMAEFWAWRRSRRTFRPFSVLAALPPRVAGTLGVAVLAAAIAVPWLLLRGGAEAPGTSPTPTDALVAPDPTFTPSTGVTSFAVPWPAAGPEGLLAYIATNGDLMVKPMPSGAASAVRKEATLRAPRWAPGGRYLAFVEDGWLVVMDQQGATTRLTQVPNHDIWGWSPADATLAWFTSEGMFLYDAGARLTRIVRGQGAPYPENPGGVFWSPEGTRILYGFSAGYSAPNRAEVTELRVLDIRSGSDILLREDGLPTQGGTSPLGWSGDGNWVFYREAPFYGASVWVGNVDSFAVPAEGGTPTKLGSTDRFADHFANAPGTDWVVFVSGGFRFASDAGRTIRFVQAGSAEELPNAAEVSVSAVAASQIGRNLAYSAMPNTPSGFDNAAMAARLAGERLWVQPLGGHPLQLTTDPAYRDEHPVWSKDGKSILFTRIDATGKGSLWQIPVTGGQPELVQDGLGFGNAGVGGVYGWIEWTDLLAWWQP